MGVTKGDVGCNLQGELRGEGKVEETSESVCTLNRKLKSLYECSHNDHGWSGSGRTSFPIKVPW